MRRLYAWVLSWAERPGGERALFGLAVAESVFFPVPPDVLLIALGLGAPRRSWRLALLCSVGSVLGGVAGYGLGYFFMDTAGNAILALYRAHDVYDRVRGLFVAYDAWVVGVAGFTPIPYKIFTLGAGAFRISFPVFVIASVLSRSARFFLVAGVIRWKGREAREFLDRYLEWAVVAFTVLLIGGFALVKLGWG